MPTVPQESCNFCKPQETIVNWWNPQGRESRVHLRFLPQEIPRESSAQEGLEMTFSLKWMPLSTVQYTNKVNAIPLFWLGNHLKQNFIRLSINGQVRQYPIPCISDLEAYFATKGLMAIECSIDNYKDWIEFAEYFLVNKIVDFRRCSLKEWAESLEEILSPTLRQDTLST
jgi:hypothetical protein